MQHYKIIFKYKSNVSIDGYNCFKLCSTSCLCWWCIAAGPQGCCPPEEADLVGNLSLIFFHSPVLGEDQYQGCDRLEERPFAVPANINHRIASLSIIPFFHLAPESTFSAMRVRFQQRGPRIADVLQLCLRCALYTQSKIVQEFYLKISRCDTESL